MSESDDSDPTTAAGRTARTLRDNASEVASETVSMGLFVGLLMASAVLLVTREAGIVSFDIPDGLLVAIAIIALIVGAAMDTSIVPE